MNKYIIWHDNDYDLANWLFLNSALSSFDVEFRCIPKTNSPKQISDYFKDTITRPIMPFIRFETPDIIIQQIHPVNKIICVTELMTHTPQWQHPAQRFTRLYTSTVLKIPTALILPRYKVKWEKGSNTNYKKVQYKCSSSVYNLFYQSTLKTHNPILLFHWPDKDGYLKYDPKHPTSPFLEDDIKYWIDFVNDCIKKTGNLETVDYQHLLDIIDKYREDVGIDSFETIEGLMETSVFLKKYNIDPHKMTKEFLENEYTLVFKPNGLVCSSSAFRTDPYAGMLCAFDIFFCRDINFNRINNLVLIAKDVNLDKVDYIQNNHDDSTCCFMNSTILLSLTHLKTCSYTQPKYRRIYGEIADLVIFDGNIIMRKGEII